MITLNASTIREINAVEVATFYLYEITYSPNEPPARWTNWDEPVAYGGHTWMPQAIHHNEVVTNADGSLSPVHVTIGNVDSERIVQQMIEQHNLIRKKVRIIQVLDSGRHLLTYEYLISAARASKGQVTFTLALGFDVFNIRVPGRRVMARFCPWHFGDADCRYTPAQGEQCEKTWQECKRRGNAINFGGFPGVTDNFIIL